MLSVAFYSLVKWLADSNRVAARLTSLKVLPCPGQGVVGGYDCEVLWVVNCQPKSFVDQLPAETRAWLEDEDKSAKCPFIPTTKLNYDEEHVAVLSQMATHVMKALAPDVEALLA